MFYNENDIQRLAEDNSAALVLPNAYASKLAIVLGISTVTLSTALNVYVKKEKAPKSYKHIREAALRCGAVEDRLVANALENIGKSALPIRVSNTIRRCGPFFNM